MKQVLKYFLVACSVLILVTPSFGKSGPDKAIDVAKYKGSKITIGTEGGTAKIRDEKIILHSGQVYEHDVVKNEYKYLKTLSGKDARRVFSMFDGAAKSSFNHPGTSSSFVQQDHNGDISYYYIWGEEGVEVPEYVLSGYTEILKIIR